MLVSLSIKHFKSIRQAHIRFGPFTCFTGHNGEGKERRKVERTRTQGRGSIAYGRARPQPRMTTRETASGQSLEATALWRDPDAAGQGDVRET